MEIDVAEFWAEGPNNVSSCDRNDTAYTMEALERGEDMFTAVLMAVKQMGEGQLKDGCIARWSGIENQRLWPQKWRGDQRRV